MIWESLRGEKQRKRTYNCSTRAKRGSTPPLVASPHRLLQKPPEPLDSDFKASTHTPRFSFPFQFYVAAPCIIICYSLLNCLLHSCVLSRHYSGHKLLYRWIFFFYLPARRGCRMWQGPCTSWHQEQPWNQKNNLWNSLYKTPPMQKIGIKKKLYISVVQKWEHATNLVHTSLKLFRLKKILF